MENTNVIELYDLCENKATGIILTTYTTAEEIQDIISNMKIEVETYTNEDLIERLPNDWIERLPNDCYVVWFDEYDDEKYVVY